MASAATSTPERSRSRRRPRIDSGAETLHGRKLAYHRAGFGEGVLLIHGITNRAASWDPVIRRPALPGAEQVISLLASEPLLDAGAAVGRALGKVGIQLGPDLAEVSAGIASLGDAERRAAFVRTVRSVMSPLGQRINATDRL